MVYKWALQIPNLSPELTRRAYLYLPACYDEQPDARFPVMYMFDGHNVFFDEDATFGKSWGMNDYMERTGKQLIIVGVECGDIPQRGQQQGVHAGQSPDERHQCGGQRHLHFCAENGRGRCCRPYGGFPVRGGGGHSASHGQAQSGALPEMGRRLPC